MDEAKYLYLRLRSPSLDLEEFKRILGDEFQACFGEKIRIKDDEIILAFYRDDDGTFFAALCYNFDGRVWLIDFNKKVRKVSYRWVDDHRQGMHFQARLKGVQTLYYGTDGKILFMEKRNDKHFLALA